MKKTDWTILERFGVTPDNLTVGGSLNLSGKSITSLPDNLTVGGSLYLSGTSIASLPDNLTVGGSLDLRGTSIASLPDNLTVGGSLELRGTSITNHPVVYGCGDVSRAIYIDLVDSSLCCIGCFKGTKSEAETAIRRKYTGAELEQYLAKLDELYNHPARKA